MRAAGFVALAAVLSITVAAPLARAEGPTGMIMMASTIGPVDAGIVGALEDAYEKETGVRVRHTGAGTGAALDIARKGAVDVCLVHAKALEEKFVAEGFGTARIPLMYNDFVIVGPPEDPAKIAGMTSAIEALKTIAAAGAHFVTRGDNSGTHVAEKELWDKAGIKPAGTWYEVYAKGAEGNGPTLRYTDEKKAYTVIDRATVITMKDKIVNLKVLVENDVALLNFISLIPVSAAKLPRVNEAGAKAFVAWATDPAKGQAIIKSFGVDKYGAPLFFPNSDQWRAANAGK